MNALGPSLALHLPVLFGLLMGTLARYGMVLDGNGVLVPRRVLGHLMMLGVCGLVAEFGADLAHLPPLARAIAGASAALCAGKVVERLRRNGEADLDRILPLPPAATPKEPLP